MDEVTREAVCSAAVRAAKAVDYEGAGTIEFIADASEGLRADRIWFPARHPAAGRAPGDRGDHRSGPGRMAAAGGERGTAAEKAGRTVHQRLGNGSAALRRGPRERL